MLKSCPYCGKIHDSRMGCKSRPVKTEKPDKPDTPATRIRNTSHWQKTRDYVRERDGNVCALCKINYEGTVRRIEYQGLSVHHIEPIKNDENKAFLYENLITLCGVHHRMAEKGNISKELLLKLAASAKNTAYPPSL